MNDIIINNGWKFFRGDIPAGYYMGLDDVDWQDVTLPHDWSVHEDFDIDFSSGTGYLSGGIGWYRKHFTLPDDIAGKSVYITFGGVYNNSRVWCNSNYLGKRPYGYSSFTYDISEFVVPGENVISVKVDRKHLADSRWFTGCGIYRDVTLHIGEKIHFDINGGVFVHCENITAKSADVTVEWHIAGGESEAEFEIMLDDANVAKVSSFGSSGSTTVVVEDPQLWSVDSPVLYKLVCKAVVDGIVVDSTGIDFGIRSLRFDVDGGFYLNEENIKIKGVCVHHDAGALGAAVPGCVWERRLKKLKQCGCNAIRTSHNPPDTKLLDLCDKMGFLVMDEAFDEWEGFKNKWWHGHNVYPPKHYGYADDFHEWHEKDLSAMVIRDRNHPCIIMWSIGNEIDYPNDPYVHSSFPVVLGNNDNNKPEQERKYDDKKPDAKRLTTVAKELVSIVKKHDATRPVTAALSFPEMSNLIGLPETLDIVGYNYKEKFYDEDHKKYPGRFIFGSENGKTSDAWQYVAENDYICGQFLWTGIDYLGEAHGWPYRASGAGVMMLNGNEKPNYYHRAALWSNDPIVKLATFTEAKRESFSWNYNNDEDVDIYCFTNADEAELFLNGRSLGKKICGKNEGTVKWNIRFEPGELKVICKYSSGKEISDVLRSAGEAVSMDVVPFKSTFGSDDILQFDVTLYDSDGNIAVDDNSEIFAEAEGGEMIGIENGDIKDLTPYYSPSRRAYFGKLIVYIRPANTETQVKLCLKTDKNILKTILY